MALGDVNYVWVQSGSTATSVAAIHNLFGSYGGLSDLNSNDVLHLQAIARNEFAYVGPSGSISNNFGFVLDPAASVVDFPPMKRTVLESFQFSRGASDSDATIFWTVWKRQPL